jgi:hypothetical protein
VHHERKGGGQHGEGIAGSHAFLALTDIALEVLRDDKSPKRRIIRGYGRIVTVPDLCYEMGEDGTLVPLGDPEELALEQVKERALSLLTEEWQSLRDIMSGMGDPKPSEDQVRRALNALVEEGKAERDPPLGTKGNKAHRWRLAASPFRFDGHTFNRNETEPVAQEEGLPEEEWGSSVRQEPPFRFDGQSINRNETEPAGQGAPAHPADPLAQAQEETHPSRQPEDPPPLPAGIRHICPRCGGEVEMLKTKAQCLSCLLIFAPPRIPKWALEVLWEEAAQGEFPDTGRLSGQEFPDTAGVSGQEFPDTGGLFGQEFPDTRRVSGQEFPDKAGEFPDTTGVSGQFPDTCEEFPDTEFPDRVSGHDFPDGGRVSGRLEGVSGQPRGVCGHHDGLSGHPGGVFGHGVSGHCEGVPGRHCLGCGKGLTLAPTGRPRRWCSDACRKRYQRPQGGPLAQGARRWVR